MCIVHFIWSLSYRINIIEYHNIYHTCDGSLVASWPSLKLAVAVSYIKPTLNKIFIIVVSMNFTSPYNKPSAHESLVKMVR